MKFQSIGAVGRTFMLVLLSWLALTTQAQAQPDLTVAGPITGLGSSVVAGWNYDLGATIQSTAAAQFGYIGVYLSRNNTWDASDTYLNAVGTSLIIPPHSARLTINVTIPAATPPGSYYMVFVADPLNMEPESNEQNNVLVVPVSISAGTPAQLPDVKLWRPSISFATSPAGGQIGAFTFVSNQGTGSAANVELGYYLSVDTLLSTNDVILGTSAGGTLGPNNMTISSNPVLTIPVSTTPGRYYVLLVADHLNRIVESDETNNSRALAITITGAITALKAAVAAPRLYPNPVASGQLVYVELKSVTGQASTTLVLHNMLGQEVLRRRVVLVNGAGQLDVAGVAPGQYLLTVDGTAGTGGWQRLLVE